MFMMLHWCSMQHSDQATLGTVHKGAIAVTSPKCVDMSSPTFYAITPNQSRYTYTYSPLEILYILVVPQKYSTYTYSQKYSTYTYSPLEILTHLCLYFCHVIFCHSCEGCVPIHIQCCIEFLAQTLFTNNFGSISINMSSYYGRDLSHI